MLHRPHLPRTCRADRILLAVLIAGTAWLELASVRGPGELSAVWVGSGLPAGWLLTRRTRTWPGYLAVAYVAELPARLLAGGRGVAPHAWPGFRRRVRELVRRTRRAW